MEDLNIKTTGEFSGVGLQIYMYEDKLTVVGLIEGSPAFRAGIFTGDQITHIDGVSTDGMELKDATSKIRGEKGTDVVLTIKKPITEEVHDYTINRDIIIIKETILSFNFNSAKVLPKIILIFNNGRNTIKNK